MGIGLLVRVILELVGHFTGQPHVWHTAHEAFDAWWDVLNLIATTTR
jgi:hypothetical protein